MLKIHIKASSCTYILLLQTLMLNTLVQCEYFFKLNFHFSCKCACKTFPDNIPDTQFDDDRGTMQSE